ncbi:MAG: hypothetical protein AAF603_07570 [Pseudomonadota bacterium]
MWSVLFTTVLVASPPPSDGDIFRELATDAAAFDRADLDGDGQVDDAEFDAYKRKRTPAPSSATAKAKLGGYDLNGDDALTPYELYPEADYQIRVGRPVSTQAVDDGARPVDDRD